MSADKRTPLSCRSYISTNLKSTSGSSAEPFESLQSNRYRPMPSMSSGHLSSVRSGSILPEGPVPSKTPVAQRQAQSVNSHLNLLSEGPLPGGVVRSDEPTTSPRTMSDLPEGPLSGVNQEQMVPSFGSSPPRPKAKASVEQLSGRMSEQSSEGPLPSAGSLLRQESTEHLNESDIRQQKYSTLSDGMSETEAQTYMSVMWSGGKLGVAYYDMDSTQIHVMLDTLETDDFLLLKKVQHQVEPTCIVMSSKQDDRMIKALQPPETRSTGGDEDLIHLLPSIDFSLDTCKRRILSLNLPSIPQHFTDSERTLYMSSLLPFENANMVRALGGLLKFLDKKRVGVELEDTDIRVPVLAISTFSLDELIVVDENTYSALQVFQREAHPSVYKAGLGNSGKEGLSLYVVDHYVYRKWFLQPLKKQGMIEERLDAVTFFVNPRNMEVTTALQDCLKHVKFVPKVLARMTQAQASLGDWQALYKTAYNAIYLGDICRAQSANIDIFTKIGHTFTEDLHKIANLISKIVDFDESAIQNRFCVKPNVDSELDEKKRTYNGLPDFMTKVAKEELDHLSDDITECNVTYLPQLGYLLAIPKTDTLSEEDDFYIPKLDFVFLSNQTLHYKSASTRELDRLLGDTQCDITDHETSIMHRLQNTVLEHSKVLLDVMKYAAQLDCLMALAACAREGNYCRPEMTQANVIHIKGGRHPLQELCCSPFVPNDTLSGGPNGKMKILTGPNASGKSVYLKQVALIVFMAHIGSFVPAEAALIGLTDRIFTRIRTMESVSVGLSTFMIDLNQVSIALRCATERSLVILDEFGKGTESVDGLSLLCACLQHWLAKGASCPYVFVSTHFHSVVQKQLLGGSDQLTYQTMEVLQDGAEMVFLYQLTEGSTNHSYACHIACQAGLPQEIVKRGAEVSELLSQGKPVHRVDTASTDTQFKRCAAIVSNFMDLDLEQADLQAFLQDFIIPASKDVR